MPRKGQRRYKNWLTTGFPGWLQERLEERGWLAVELAERIGVNSGVISNYMIGARTPDPKILQRIADVLDVSDEEIFTAVGYLREMTLPDDPRRLELMRRIQTIELTPDRYDLLSNLLSTMQGTRPASTEMDWDEVRDPSPNIGGLFGDPLTEGRRSPARDEEMQCDRVG